MPFAIAILLVVAVASVAGTLLPQNAVFGEFSLKFGPFWTRFFFLLGLGNIYASPLFLALLAFLVASTGLCLSRQGPVMARLLMRKLSSRPLGYLFTHAGIVVIACGGLVDGNLPLRLEEWLGHKKPESRDIPAKKMPLQSILPEDNLAFRAGVNLPEGASADFAFINVQKGFYLQKLPFSLTLKAFHMDFYPTGAPRDFVSEIEIKDGKTSLAGTLRVNHPMTYRGITLYQASFGDGGTEVSLLAWPLRQNGGMPRQVSAMSKSAASWGGDDITWLEFREMNVENVGDTRHPRSANLGPAFRFEVRKATGEREEYFNYMLPVRIEGRWFMVSGVRPLTSASYEYLRLPLDKDNSLSAFMAIAQAIADPEMRQAIAKEVASEFAPEDAAFASSVQKATLTMLARFSENGFEGVTSHLSPEETEKVAEGLITLLQRALAAAWRLTQHSSPPSGPFLQDTLLALSDLPAYGLDTYFQPQSYERRLASGILLTRSPGKPWVFTGALLLILGVFLQLFWGSGQGGKRSKTQDHAGQKT